MMVPVAEAKLVIVTGAGASTALGTPEPLPMMGDWCQRIVQALDKREPGLAKAVGLLPGMGGEAFEEAIGYFLQWQRDSQLIRRFSRLGSPPGQVQTERGDFQDWLKNAETRTPTVIEAVNNSLWDEFGLERVDTTSTVAAYEHLAAAVGARPSGGTLLFSATTNYDRSGETGWEENGFHCDDGGRTDRPGASRFLRVEQVQPWLDRSTIPHLHLHGAVGWYRVPRGGIMIEPADRPYDARLAPAVLYPDPNKDPYNETDAGVQALWQSFDKALDSCTHILVLGHSLHDSPLLTALARRARDGHLRLAVSYFGDEPAAKLILDQLSGTLLASGHVDLSLIPVAFGPDCDLAGIEAWVGGQTIGLDLLPPRLPAPTGTTQPVPRPDLLDLTSFDLVDVVTGTAEPISDVDAGPAIQLLHNTEDTLVVLRDPPPGDFLFECDVRLTDGGLLNIRRPRLARNSRRYWRTCKLTLGTTLFGYAVSEGRALSLEEAVAYARRGRGNYNRARSGWDSLTASEQQVASLVGQHLTNAQIAERLFISVPTVKSHLNRAFAKLGTKNRGQLAAAAHRIEG